MSTGLAFTVVPCEKFPELSHVFMVKVYSLPFSSSLTINDVTPLLRVTGFERVPEEMPSLCSHEILTPAKSASSGSVHERAIFKCIPVAVKPVTSFGAVLSSGMEIVVSSDEVFEFSINSGSLQDEIHNVRSSRITLTYCFVYNFGVFVTKFIIIP
mgnify:CR=1 FL=1